MLLEDTKALADLHLSRIDQAARLARAGRQAEDPYDRVERCEQAKRDFDLNARALKQVISRYLGSVEKEVSV